MQLLEYSFFQNALISTILISISCGLIGTYIVAKRMVFISGGISHSSFGGLGIAYYLGLPPFFGATIFAILSGLGILKLSRTTKLREDSLIGIFWSTGMALGVIFIALSPGYAPNLMSFLFGNILTITNYQIIASSIISVIIILFFILFSKPLFYIAFDREYAMTQNSSINIIEIGITILISLTIVLCMKLAGIILVISYLTIPQAISGLIFGNFRQQLPTSIIISLVGSILGLYISSWTDIPSGAAIIMTFLLIFIIVWGYIKIKKLKIKI